jgi:hypothetical protein
MLQRNVSRQAINDKGRGRSVEFVMPGLDRASTSFSPQSNEDVDGRDIWREDALRAFGPAMTESG